MNRSTPDWTIRTLLAWATQFFTTHQLDSPRSTAEILLAHALGLEKIDLYLQHDKPLNSDELALFKPLIKRRLNREPVAYIVGTKGFWNLDLAVDRSVLIPRPDTECLVEAVLDILPKPGLRCPDGGFPRVLDLGTGSGAVVLALAAERPDGTYFASDVSVDALVMARKNAVAHGLDHRVRFFGGNWMDPLPGDGPGFHAILSNPPYIPSRDIDGLQAEVSRFEPRIALDGSGDGLACLRRIIADAHSHLVPGGHLLLEIGHDQKPMVRQMVDQCGRYESLTFFSDYGGRDRVARMQRKR